MRLLLAFALAMSSSVPSLAEPKIDVQGLILGNEGARYVKGVPTLDLQQQRGFVQVRFLGWDHSNAVFVVGVYNGGSEPVNIGLEDFHASAGANPIRLYTVDELERQAKNRATWKAVALALVGGIGAAAAANQRDSYSGHIVSPYGTAHFYGSSPSLAGQLQSIQIQQDTRYGMAAIRAQLDATIEGVRDKVIQRTTVDPGTSYGGIIVAQKLDYGKVPIDFRLDIDWNGERYPFGYVLVRKGHPIPQQYAANLASNAKPMALLDRTSASVPVARPTVTTAPAIAPPGAIYVRPGVFKIPAKTPSGYCLRAPQSYMGTRSSNMPAVTTSLPRCADGT